MPRCMLGSSGEGGGATLARGYPPRKRMRPSFVRRWRAHCPMLATAQGVREPDAAPEHAVFQQHGLPRSRMHHAPILRFGFCPAVLATTHVAWHDQCSCCSQATDQGRPFRPPHPPYVSGLIPDVLEGASLGSQHCARGRPQLDCEPARGAVNDGSTCAGYQRRPRSEPRSSRCGACAVRSSPTYATFVKRPP